MATEHFSDAELACRCGCLGVPDRDFQAELEVLRVQFGHPMRLSSAYRCPEHNARVSRTGRNGPHTIGAVDVLIFGERGWDLVDVATELGWTGVGFSQKGPHESRFIHLDRRETPCVWSY